MAKMAPMIYKPNAFLDTSTVEKKYEQYKEKQEIMNERKGEQYNLTGDKSL